MAIDIKLTQDSFGGFDISIDDGDLETVDSFDTSIQVSLFSDRRADASEVPPVELRRGWWANSFLYDDGFQTGSKLWLLEQARATQAKSNSATDYGQSALDWFVSDGHAKSIEVTTELQESGISMAVEILRDQGVTETRYYDLWNNTGAI